MGELELREQGGSHGLEWRTWKQGESGEANAEGEITKNWNQGEGLGSEWKEEGSSPRYAQQTLEERKGRTWDWDGAYFHCQWKEEVPHGSTLTSSPFPPERCLNQQWRGASWWSGIAFASPTVAGPLKPPVSELHDSLPWFGDNKCRDSVFCIYKNQTFLKALEYQDVRTTVSKNNRIVASYRRTLEQQNLRHNKSWKNKLQSNSILEQCVDGYNDNDDMIMMLIMTANPNISYVIGTVLSVLHMSLNLILRAIQ